MQDYLSTPLEEWRPVVGYEGWYEVSNLGRVKRIGAGRGAVPGRTYRGHVGGWGYRIIRLNQDSHGQRFPVHTLVAEAFLGSRPEGHEINHRDGNKANNRVANLEWVTRSQNNRHAIRTGLRPALACKGIQHGMAKLSEPQVHEIRRLRHRITQRAIADHFHISKDMVWRIQNRWNWQHI